MAQKNNVLMEKKGDQVNDQRSLLMRAIELKGPVRPVRIIQNSEIHTETWFWGWFCAFAYKLICTLQFSHFVTDCLFSGSMCIFFLWKKNQGKFGKLTPWKGCNIWQNEMLVYKLLGYTNLFVMSSYRSVIFIEMKKHCFLFSTQQEEPNMPSQ